EARDTAEVREACGAKADLILLDNMTPAQVKRIIGLFGERGIPFEVSGGVNLKNIGAYAKTGADRISVGALTHSAAALDLSLQLFPKD
ncbi:nicotinate-nucleotide diphosphorylase (carboxylating), partial [Candidatus Sumerlaeota bacterium]|nr:nicotinate-nucleotide diphosphorylase (carboxylating) [Candidatus Sumerlaeota bacterium]